VEEWDSDGVGYENEKEELYPLPGVPKLRIVDENEGGICKGRRTGLVDDTVEEGGAGT
jgi:hypothetical protein